MFVSCNGQPGPLAGPGQTSLVSGRLQYEPDAHVLADALAAGAEFFVTLDQQHLETIPQAG